MTNTEQVKKGDLFEIPESDDDWQDYLRGHQYEVVKCKRKWLCARNYWYDDGIVQFRIADVAPLRISPSQLKKPY